MHTSTLLLVGPNKLSRVGLKSLFEGSPFTVIGEVSDIAAIDPYVLPEADIALLECSGDADTALDPLDAVDALERLDEIYPDMPVVVLNDKVDMATLAACLAAGASGFVTKDISSDVLLRSLQLAVLGETVFPTYLAGILADEGRERKALRIPVDNVFGLSDREVETLQSLLHGESNKLIARRLRIAEATIKVHMKSVMRKIKVSNRTQAAIWAFKHGYVPARDATLGVQGEGGSSLN